MFLLIINLSFVFHFKDRFWAQGARTSVLWGPSTERGKCMTNCNDKAVLVPRYKGKYNFFLNNADGAGICNPLYCGEEKQKHVLFNRKKLDCDSLKLSSYPEAIE